MTGSSASTVSVIIPTWNRAAWLTPTVQSALAQTVPPMEVIVVDDGSIDDTAEVAGRFGDRIRYLRQENAGVAAARNAGARVARGDWLGFLDCEDLWEPQKLEIQLAVMEACRGAGWCVTDCTVMDLEDRPTPGEQGFRRVFPPFRATGLDPDAFFRRGLDERELRAGGRRLRYYTGDPFRLLFSGNFGLPSSALVRRDVFEASGGFDPSWRLAEETEFFHRLAVRSPVVVVMERLVRYRVGQAGALTSPANTVTLMRNALRSQEQAFASRPDPNEADREAHAEGRRRLLLDLTRAHLANYDSRQARTTFGAWLADGGRLSARVLLLFLLSRLPPLALRAVHRLKRMVP